MSKPHNFKFRFGLEEEYFVVDLATDAVKQRHSRPFMKGAKARLGDRLANELLQCQIEVTTTPVESPEQARRQLRQFRSSLVEVGRVHQVGIVAAGTHPLASHQEQAVTDSTRYRKLIEELGQVGLGNATCALHVHVEVPEPDRRIELMRRAQPFVPVLLALSTSSPFWAGSKTGLFGYRNAATDSFPRSGLAEPFESAQEYDAFITTLVAAGAIEDSTQIWWALRPSRDYPTLELRVTDVCTSIEDAVCIASLYRAIVHHLVCVPQTNAGYSPLDHALTHENRWRAQRYGTDGTYIDLESRKAIPFAKLLDRMLERLQPDFLTLGIQAEIPRLRAIPKRGTSAHWQVALYDRALATGYSPETAMRNVAAWLRRSTESGELLMHPLLAVDGLREEDRRQARLPKRFALSADALRRSRLPRDQFGGSRPSPLAARSSR